ncbi:DUF192 domain-containing protein [Mesorhizobium sp. Z1-4]|uniref:DUF192 domain-containing protein n=1 Tax=Mesorhizobium sp. Z1-4 TaxID=2448478 RepID=UPI000FDBC754|nr:DUF192 domain-containing protein [Mesorhizobium sp. Z1-4]
MRRLAAYLAILPSTLLLAASLYGTLALAQGGQPMLLPVDPAPLIIETQSGPRSFSVEIADEGSERARGLMYRQNLPETRGMLFVFENTRRVAFWMKNTPLPLDLIFIGEDGKVSTVGQGEPFSEAPIAAAGPVRFVLEVHQGTAAGLGVAPGDRLHHPIIDAIAEAR